MRAQALHHLGPAIPRRAPHPWTAPFDFSRPVFHGTVSGNFLAARPRAPDRSGSDRRLRAPLAPTSLDYRGGGRLNLAQSTRRDRRLWHCEADAAWRWDIFGRNPHQADAASSQLRPPVDCDKPAEKGNRKHTRHDRSHHILAFFLLRSLHLRQLSSDDRAGVAVQSRPTYFAALRPRTFDALVCHARW